MSQIPTSENVTDNSQPYIRFPPFPTPPSGVSIIPFSEFKPGGIRINIDPKEGDTELDSLGIPTVELRVKHDLTEAEQRKRRKKRRVANNGSVRRPLWYEVWDEGEDLRKTSTAIDPSHNRVDRLHQACQDFRTGRQWPAPNAGVAPLWDTFRLYIGVISSVQPPAVRKTNQQHAQMEAEAADDEGIVEDEDDDEMQAGGYKPKEQKVLVVDESEASTLREERAVAPRERTEEEEEARQQRYQEFRERKDARMDFFLNDPEKSIKVFFSSYYRDKGLIWSEPRARDGPILVRFFLEFLLRNRVLHELDYEKGLRKALAVVEKARIELPWSFVLAKAIPDRFSSGCTTLWGSMIESMQLYGDDDDADSDAAAPATKDEQPAVDKDDNPWAVGAGDDTNVESGWGVLDEDGTTVAGKDPWATQQSEIWGETLPNPLMALLGATVLPLTHTTGIVEESVRCITAVHPAGKTGGKKKKRRSEAGLVEDELDARFARLVLGPWKTWDSHNLSDVGPPNMKAGSRGAVVEADTEGAVAAAGEGAHNPYKDEITVMIEPSSVEKMKVGMGLRATWIQIARQDVSKQSEQVIGEKQRRRKGQKGGWGEPAQPTKYWYMEQLMAVIPSYHTDGHA